MPLINQRCARRCGSRTCSSSPGLLFSGQIDEGDQVLAGDAHLRRLLRRSGAPVTCSTTCSTASTTGAAPRSAIGRSPAERSRPATATAVAILLAVGTLVLGFAVETRGRRNRRGLRRDHRRLLPVAQAARDPRRDDDRFAVHSPRRRRRGRGRGRRRRSSCSSAPGMLALFLGFTKRRQEAMLEGTAGVGEAPAAPAADPAAPGRGAEEAGGAFGIPSRPVLEHYSLPFLDQMIAMVTDRGDPQLRDLRGRRARWPARGMLATAPVGALRRLSLPLSDL